MSVLVLFQKPQASVFSEYYTSSLCAYPASLSQAGPSPFESEIALVAPDHRPMKLHPSKCSADVFDCNLLPT